MVLLSKIFNSIRGALTPRRKKRSREEMSACGVNEVQEEEASPQRTRHRPEVNKEKAPSGIDDPSHSRLKMGIGNANAGVISKVGRTYAELLPSVEVVKNSSRGTFVWKEFPAPSPSSRDLSQRGINTIRKDIPDRIIGSAAGTIGGDPQYDSFKSVSGYDKVSSREHHLNSVLQKDLEPKTNRDSNFERDAPSGPVPSKLRPGTPKSESAAHMEFYARFLERMQVLMSLNTNFKRSDMLLEKESPKHAYEYHCERIQKLTHKARALLDYSAAEKRQLELQEIETNISKIRELRLKPKSDVSYTRIIPLPQITNADRETFSDLVNREPNEAVLRHEGSKVCLMGNDLSRLNPGCWLNDEIINLYMRLLQERDTRLHAEGKEKYPSCHFFNSFFLSKLYKDTGSYDYESVRRWTAPGRLKAIGQTRKSILDCEKIIIPVNQSNVHWVLAVIDLKNKRFEYFDSLYGEDDACLDFLSQYLMDEFKNKRNEERPDILEWPKVYPKSIPKQVNGYDCGVFLILFADYLSKSAKLDFSQKNIENFRVKLALDFSRMEVP